MKKNGNNLTFSIIKPDAVHAHYTGAILAMIEEAGFTIKAMKMVQITPFMAEQLYKVHAQRSFYQELCTFITSGPVVMMVLAQENAVANLRNLMGATDPAAALDGTIRKRFATSIEKNAIHGADSAETAGIEIAFFFPDLVDIN